LAIAAESGVAGVGRARRAFAGVRIDPVGLALVYNYVILITP
jgi:hypothetical protein